MAAFVIPGPDMVGTMGILGEELGAQIKAELEERGTPLEPESPEPTETDADDDAEKPAKAEEGDDLDGGELETKPEPGQDTEIDDAEKFEDSDPALDQVLELGGQKATLRELFEAHKNKFDPGHFTELVQGIESDRAQYQEAAQSLNGLAEVRKHPGKFYVSAMQQDEAEGRMPKGSAEAFSEWMATLAQSGAINPAKWDQDMLQEQHAKTLSERESQYEQRITKTEAMSDMAVIQTRYGRMSEKDTATLKAEVAASVAKGQDRTKDGQVIEHLVLRKYEELRKAGKISAGQKPIVSTLKAADRTRRRSTGKKPIPTKKPTELTRDEMEQGLRRALRGA